MKHNEFKTKTKRWNQFSAVDTLGSFDFFTNLISLDALKKEDLAGIAKVFNGAQLAHITEGGLSVDQYNMLAKVIPLAVHEYTHFIDSTSTLWGLRHLQLMHQAYTSDVRYGGEESSFYFAKQFHDHVKNIRLPSYYTVINKNAVNTTPWRYMITLGKTFNSEGKLSNRPVLFTRFNNREDRYLTRSPISVVSILEASAMAQEVYMHSILINSISGDFKLVEQREHSKIWLDYLYNPELTEYSVCLHLLANHLGTSDAAKIYPLCAALTRLVLNFPRSSFFELKKRCQIDRILNIPKTHDFVSRIRDGLAVYDIGILYYLLCRALPTSLDLSQPDAIASGIDAALKNLGTNEKDVMREAMSEFRKIIQLPYASQIGPISQLTSAGASNFFNISFAQPHLNFEKLHLPPVLLGDSTETFIFHSATNLLANFDITACFNELFKGQLWVENFTEACV